MIRVVIVDDHELVRAGLRYVLEDDGMQVIGETGSAAEATRRIPALRPDVCLLDYRLPDGNGIQVCRDVKAVDPTLKCLILTSFDDDEALRDALTAGACGYILKEVNTRSLLQAIRQAAAGHTVFPPRTGTRLDGNAAHPDTRPVWPFLSEREQQILAFIAEGLSNRQIALRLHLAEHTVKNHVSALLPKLGVHHRTQAAVLFLHTRTGP